MALHVALLRGVNVGGHQKVAMRELAAFLSALGLEEPRTLLNSGNALFRCRAGATARLEERLEREAKERLGLETRFLVRTAGEWGAAVAANPFPEEAERDPALLHLMPLKGAPTAAAVRALRAAIPGREKVEVAGREAYLFYPDGAGRSKLTIDVVERHLGFAGTARNWNTVRKLAALL